MHSVDPFLYFNFKHEDRETPSFPFYFKNPIKTIIAYQTKDVIPCLNKAQKYNSKGYYVAGYLSYEAASSFNPEIPKQENIKLPLLWFGIFHKKHRFLQSEFNFNQYKKPKWDMDVSYKDYEKKFHRVQKYLYEGKTEQINYTVRLNAKIKGDYFSYFKELEKAQEASYNAYFNLGDFSILSLSPELFFHLNQDYITVKPMKGTIHRGKTYEEDQQLKEWLKNSKKNRLENKMITDLMSNELKKITERSTIKTINPYKVQQYPTVYQMTTTLQAKLQKNIDLTNIFQNLFPCGSITGPNKQKTMKIIHTLENHPREIYCGAIGYMTPEKKAIFNVPIRTIQIDRATNRAYFGVGGAITKTSKPKEEYKEIWTKAKFLSEKRPSFKLLESFGLKNGSYIAYSYHIKRLMKSAKYFSFSLPIQAIEEKLNEVAMNYPTKDWKVRLVVNKKGKFKIDISPVKRQTPKYINVNIAKEPIDASDVFFYHKTTYRNIYERLREEDDLFFDTLLWNKKEELTEFTMGNLVIEEKGRYFTPPVSSGLLPGTYREMLLDEGMIQKKVLTLSDLNRNVNVWFINSVREWIPVKIYF